MKVTQPCEDCGELKRTFPHKGSGKRLCISCFRLRLKLARIQYNKKKT